LKLFNSGCHGSNPAIEPKQSRLAAALAIVQGAPKWILMAVPADVIALGGYAGLHSGYY